MNLMKMYKPHTPPKTPSPYKSGRKNPDYVSPNFVSQPFLKEDSISTQNTNHPSQNQNYYTYYNQSQKKQILNKQATQEKIRYANILKQEEQRFDDREKNYFLEKRKQISTHEISSPNISLNQIKRNSQVELNTSWTNGVICKEIKQENRKQEKQQLYQEIDQSEKNYQSQQIITQEIQNYKAQSYLRGLQLQNRHNQYLKEVEKTKSIEEEIIRKQEQKIQDLRRQQEQLQIAKSKFTK